jgi:hypothetical protein
LIKRNNINNSITITEQNNTLNNNITNITNNITNHITNHIYIDIKPTIPPISFDDDWDLSAIGSTTQLGILFSKLMYSALLEELLKNDKNLNVILDANSESGIVYKNDNEKYIEMKNKDIIDKTMEKLKNQLLEINKTSKTFMLDEEFFVHCRRMITKKQIDYDKDIEIQNNIIQLMSELYEKKKDNSLNILQYVIDKDAQNKLLASKL